MKHLYTAVYCHAGYDDSEWQKVFCQTERYSLKELCEEERIWPEIWQINLFGFMVVVDHLLDGVVK